MTEHRRPGRKPRQVLWDDLQFRHRVQDLVRERGLVLSDVLRSAGVPVDYTYRSAEGRNTNVLMRLAEILDVPTFELLGINFEPPGGAPYRQQTHVRPSPAPQPTPEISDVMLRRIERQNTTAIFIALAMVRGDRLSEIAEALGMRERDVTELLRQQATPDPVEKPQSE